MSTTPDPVVSAEDIRTLVESFWAFVQSGAPGDTPAWQARFATGGLVAPDGAFLDLESHQALHRPLTAERHCWREMTITTLASRPPRVLVETTVSWTATVRATDQRIVAEVDQRWIIERLPTGELRFNQWWSPAIRYLGGDAIADGLGAGNS